MTPPATLAPLEGASSKLTTIQIVGGIRCNLCKLTFGDKKEYDCHYQNHFIGRPQIVYSCVICMKEFTGYAKFRGHCYSSHVSKEKIKCVHCDKSFSRQSALNFHCNAVHLFKCTRCQKEYPSKRELNLHEYIHKNASPPYKCISCNQEIMTSDQCEDHIDLHSEVSYSCLICEESIENKQTAASHLCIHFNYMNEEIESDTDDGSYLQTDSSINEVGGIHCIYCDDLFKDRVEFQSHQSSEHSDQPQVYSCGVCLKQFSLYFHFGRHVYHHLAKNRFQCEVCDKFFDRLSHLVLHMEAFHTAPGNKPFSCIHCSRAFQTEMRLRTHLREFHNTFSLTCQEKGCEQVFKTPKELVLHSKIHRNIENRCRFCGLQFISMSACLRHFDLHCKTVFSCPVCDKKYAEKYLLKKHMTQHFEVVIHLCKVCGKIFNARNRLVEHTKIHTTSSKLHTCSYCGKGFSRLLMLQQHLNIHSGLKPFKCHECQKTFASYPNWGKHMRRIHNFAGKLRDLLVTNSLEDNNKIKEVCKVPVKTNVPKIQIKEEILIKPRDVSSKNEMMMLEQEQMQESTHTDNLIELHNVVIDDYFNSLDNGTSMKHELIEHPPAAQYPLEYGPEFTYSGELLDELLLPHINPYLATKTEPAISYDYQY